MLEHSKNAQGWVPTRNEKATERTVQNLLRLSARCAEYQREFEAKFNDGDWLAENIDDCARFAHELSQFLEFQAQMQISFEKVNERCAKIRVWLEWCEKAHQLVKMLQYSEQKISIGQFLLFVEIAEEIGLPQRVKVLQRVHDIRRNVLVLQDLSKELQMSKLQSGCQTISQIDVQAYFDMNSRKKSFRQVSEALQAIKEAYVFDVSELLQEIDRSQIFYEDLQNFVDQYPVAKITSAEAVSAMIRAQEFYQLVQKVQFTNYKTLAIFVAFYLDLRTKVALQEI